MTPIAGQSIPRCRQAFRVIRMLRRWVASGMMDSPRLPAMVRLAKRIGIEPQAAVALASLFQLTEECIARPILPECCGSSRLSSDERAILLMLSVARSRPPRSTADIPHGLPGALLWAVESVRRLLPFEAAPSRTVQQCPFRPELAAHCEQTAYCGLPAE
jgi:hypothetical protein